jgi:hypothetical protein
MRRKYGLLMGRMSYDERADRFDAALAAARSRSDADEVLARMMADQGMTDGNGR